MAGFAPAWFIHACFGSGFIACLSAFFVASPMMAGILTSAMLACTFGSVGPHFLRSAGALLLRIPTEVKFFFAGAVRGEVSAAPEGKVATAAFPHVLQGRERFLARPFHFQEVLPRVVCGRAPRCLGDLRAVDRQHRLAGVLSVVQPWELMVSPADLRDPRCGLDLEQLLCEVPDFTAPSQPAIDACVSWVDQRLREAWIALERPGAAATKPGTRATSPGGEPGDAPGGAPNGARKRVASRARSRERPGAAVTLGGVAFGDMSAPSVYVHCNGGRGRAALTCMCLALKWGLAQSADEAYKLIGERRPVAKLRTFLGEARGQWRAVVLYARRIERGEVEVRHWKEARVD